MSCPRPLSRYKGIERFLRRIAFNLGNTPSQTEVKIISCIPIDVTDLQNKICQLEKELEKKSTYVSQAHVSRYGCSSCNSSKRGHIVHTALVSAPPVLETSEPLPQKEIAYSLHDIEAEELHHGTSRTSVDWEPAQPDDLNTVDNHVPRETSRPNENEVNQRLPTRKLNKKLNTRKFRPKPQYIYFAQTSENSPFIERNQTTTKSYPPCENKMLPESYLTDMVRKQYQQRRLDASDASEFSTPVCRDSPPPAPRYESDACSCCQGAFHNIDDTLRQSPFLLSTNMDGPNGPQAINSIYYDSSLYDVVPVRENPILRREEDIYETQKPQVFMECEARPLKYKRFRPRAPYNVSHVAPLRHNARVNKKKFVLKEMQKKEKPIYQRKHHRQMDSYSQVNSAVEFGSEYPRMLKPRVIRMPTVASPPKPIIQVRNAECLTMNVNDSECQTASTKSVQIESIPSEDTRTKVTLDQIKAILQSVLTEVKTNSEMKSSETAHKDAVVQKDQSQINTNVVRPTPSNIRTLRPGESTLVNSYTYSPYSMDPSSSDPTSLTSPLVPPPHPTSFPFPPKCSLNYPLFIHTTGRQCKCCCRNMHCEKARPQQSVPIGDGVRELEPRRNTETEKLIKEIYKSIAINMDLLTQETPASDYRDHSASNLRNLRDTSLKVYEAASAKPMRKKSTIVAAMQGRTASTGAGSARQSRAATGSRSTVSARRRATTTSTSTATSTSLLSAPPPAPYTHTDSESESTYSSETGSQDTPVANPRKLRLTKEKPSLFKKMVSLFRGTNKKMETCIEESQEEESDDSDDYQTIYSERTVAPERDVMIHNRRWRARRVQYNKVPIVKPIPQPKPFYVEQECRRVWNEGLSLHTPGKRRPPQSQPRQQHLRSPYYRDYEARPAIVQHYPPSDYTTTHSPHCTPHSPHCMPHSPHCTPHSPHCTTHFPHRPLLAPRITNPRYPQRVLPRPSPNTNYQRTELKPTRFQKGVGLRKHLFSGNQRKKLVLGG